jgi:Alginate export
MPLGMGLGNIYGLGVNMSSQPKTLIVNLTLRKGLFLGLPLWLVLVAHVSAQESAVQYIGYPQIQGKVQPLHLSGVPKWATFDGQLRGRTENQTSDDYISGNNQLYELTRIYGGLEVHASEYLTGYIQFIDTHALGLPLKYTLPNMRDTFDDRQAYLNLHLKQYSIIAGRQELKYGDERLVGISDWTNNSRTWDGFLGRVGDKNRLDLFASSVVAVHPTSLDTHGAGLTFFGAVGTIRTWVPHSMIQPFVYVKALPRAESRQGTFGTETEVTSGAEAAGQYPTGFDFDGLIAVQRGSYSKDSIDSSAGYIKAGYTAKTLFLKPRFLGEYDYASGNTPQDSNKINTFDQQYPSNHNAFGLTDLFGFQNIKQERLNLDLTPAKHVTLLIQQEWLQAASRFDNIYSGSAGTVVTAPTTGLQSGDIGREFDASGKWVIHDYLVMNVGVGHFSPGTVMRANAHGAPLTLAYFGLTYRFKISR